jgi:hypothetical protein
MTEITQNDLMMSVLSMAAYYEVKPFSKIGNATLIESAPQLNGFAAVAYKELR